MHQARFQNQPLVGPGDSPSESLVRYELAGDRVVGRVVLRKAVISKHVCSRASASTADTCAGRAVRPHRLTKPSLRPHPIGRQVMLFTWMFWDGRVRLARLGKIATAVLGWNSLICTNRRGAIISVLAPKATTLGHTTMVYRNILLPFCDNGSRLQRWLEPRGGFSAP